MSNNLTFPFISPFKYSPIKIEGEYLNGERNGKGEEYYENGKLKFKGECLNGKKWNGEGYDFFKGI